jgi:hypothetical protein
MTIMKCCEYGPWGSVHKNVHIQNLKYLTKLIFCVNEICFTFLQHLKGRHNTRHNDIQHNNKLNVTLSIMTLSIINGSVVVLSVIYAECRYAECRGASKSD